MSLIQMKNLTFSYDNGGVPVFDHVSLSLDTNWKIGMIGRNGRGKTTLLKLLHGDYAYQGEITASVSFEYFPYPIAEPERLAVQIAEETAPEAEQWQIIRELSLLQADSEILWRPFNTLSNGEQIKLLLAALFLRENHFLLIDEPTNHMDAAGRAAVAAYLNRKKGFLLVSHDRTLLNGCVDHVLSINHVRILSCSAAILIRGMKTAADRSSLSKRRMKNCAAIFAGCRMPRAVRPDGRIRSRGQRLGRDPWTGALSDISLQK